VYIIKIKKGEDEESLLIEKPLGGFLTRLIKGRPWLIKLFD
jgi:hypothetical protein